MLVTPVSCLLFCSLSLALDFALGFSNLLVRRDNGCLDKFRGSIVSRRGRVTTESDILMTRTLSSLAAAAEEAVGDETDAVAFAPSPPPKRDRP